MAQSERDVSIVRAGYLDEYVNIHELGHNHGCLHTNHNDWPGQNDNYILNARAKGYYGTNNGSPYLTIMVQGSESGDRLQYFSSPHITVSGYGNIGDDYHNAATEMRRNAHTISRLRNEVPNSAQPVEVFSNRSDYAYGNTVTFTAVANCPSSEFRTDTRFEMSYGSAPFTVLQDGPSYQVQHSIPQQPKSPVRGRLSAYVSCSGGTVMFDQFVFYAHELSVNQYPAFARNSGAEPMSETSLLSLAEKNSLERSARLGHSVGRESTCKVYVSDALGRRLATHETHSDDIELIRRSLDLDELTPSAFYVVTVVSGTEVRSHIVTDLNH